MIDLTALSYTAEHEWVSVDDNIATFGITDYAADKLGDVVFVELPAIGGEITAGQVCGEIESTKSVGELYAPVTGRVIEVNGHVDDDPSLVNSAPFEGGWLVRVDLQGETPAGLLDRDAYLALVGDAE
ncbi:glycine cleavage system protein GcvH [Microbacterium sp. NPDC089189]|uniref:glycine cleavage system protein GcvH n=1 Tax=Microbacterium sp. NPDC089189 TaxID=3154972 RepID=UPI003418942C